VFETVRTYRLRVFFLILILFLMLGITAFLFYYDNLKVIGAI
jgi:uncharacterized membrane protein SpoIIM required for sporulation